MINSKIKNLFFSEEFKDLRLLCEKLEGEASQIMFTYNTFGDKKIPNNKLLDFNYISSVLPLIKTVDKLNFPEAYLKDNQYTIGEKNKNLSISSFLENSKMYRELIEKNRSLPNKPSYRRPGKNEKNAFILSRPIIELFRYFKSPEVISYIKNELFNHYLRTGEVINVD